MRFACFDTCIFQVSNTSLFSFWPSPCPQLFWFYFMLFLKYFIPKYIELEFDFFFLSKTQFFTIMFLKQFHVAGKTQVFLISLLGTFWILLNECPLGLVQKEEEQEKIEKVRLKLMSEQEARSLDWESGQESLSGQGHFPYVMWAQTDRERPGIFGNRKGL